MASVRVNKYIPTHLMSVPNTTDIAGETTTEWTDFFGIDPTVPKVGDPVPLNDYNDSGNVDANGNAIYDKVTAGTGTYSMNQVTRIISTVYYTRSSGTPNPTSDPNDSNITGIDHYDYIDLDIPTKGNFYGLPLYEGAIYTIYDGPTFGDVNKDIQWALTNVTQDQEDSDFYFALHYDDGDPLTEIPASQRDFVDADNEDSGLSPTLVYTSDDYEASQTATIYAMSESEVDANDQEVTYPGDPADDSYPADDSTFSLNGTTYDQNAGGYDPDVVLAPSDT